jgi:opacity protein-like surface antigen
MRGAALLVIALTVAAPASAQSAVSVRTFALGSLERMAASQTFDAELTSSVQPFWGAGGEVVFGDRFYVGVTLSRFKRTGQRAFVFNNQTFPLGVPVTARITPLEVAGGVRFNNGGAVVPYVGGGVGRYGYTETSTAADAGENVDASHAGYLVHGGAEFPIQDWLAFAADVQYTHVPGILGGGGVSAQFGESDLGGFAVRARVVFVLTR